MLTYCLMGNHLHLLLRTPEPNLGSGMKHAQEAFASFVNDKYDEHGHVFGHRFNSKLVRSDSHLWGCFRYIARNPVGAGLCTSPIEWPWSAHRALIGSECAPDWLNVDAALSTLGSDPQKGRARYARLTDSDDMGLLEQLQRSRDDDAWISEAVDDFRVSVQAVGAYLSVSRATAYRRLAGARRA